MPMESNIQKMRTALVKASTALKVCDWPDGIDMDGVNSIIAEIESAIALPDRNCDVGTTDDQAIRFIEFCNRHHSSFGRWICDDACLCKGGMGELNHCFAKWMQVPYIESGVS